jgi:hypothetical protein
MIPETKQAFFNITSEYLAFETDNYKVYKFDNIDIANVQWFLEMVWSISAIYDVRVLFEEDDGKIKVFLRTDKQHWRLHGT